MPNVKLNDEGELNSSYSVKIVEGKHGLILESWGPSDRNPDYAKAMEQILSKLIENNIPYINVYVISRNLTRAFPKLEDRVITINESTNINLSHANPHELRLAIGREVADLKEPNSKASKGGNRFKKILIHSPLLTESDWHLIAAPSKNLVIFSTLREKMEKFGFIFEKEQPPHHQGEREKELKFIHPELMKKFANDGFSTRATKFYIKPLSDDPKSDIGLTTGKTSPLFNSAIFTVPNAIDTFKNSKTNAWVNKRYDQSLNKILAEIKSYLTPSLQDVQESFLDEITDSMNKSPEERQKRLKTAQKKPLKTTVNTTIYKRNPDVVAEVLWRAGGKCGLCKTDAPFFRKKDQTPYLEVHHKVELSKGGDDTIENAIALCPNCHRKEHFG